MRDARKKYFGFEALGEIVRRLLGFNARIVEAERTVAGCAKAETGRVEAEARRVEEFAGMKGTVERQAEVITDAAGRVSSGLEALDILGRDVAAAELGRATAEEARSTAETKREAAEATRAGAERARVEQETARVDSEKSREAAETTRTGNEKARVEAETGRTGAEQKREEAERKRAEEFKGFADTLNDKADVTALSNVLATDPLTGGMDLPDTPEYRRLFIDMWNEAWGKYGGYDAGATDGHPFLGNGVRMTYEEALAVLNRGHLTNSNTNGRYANSNIRTHMPPFMTMSVTQGDYVFTNSKVESVNAFRLNPGRECFKNCVNLKRITVHCPAPLGLDSGIYDGCSSLVTLTVTNVYAQSFSLADSPLISRISLWDIISKTGLGGWTLTVHPDVYAKLTDETNAEWHTLVALAAARNLQFATV